MKSWKLRRNDGGLNKMATRIEPIKGKIAKILNSREVALNVGATQGVHPGMLFEIMPVNQSEVQDPDTGEILGFIASPKVEVKVTRVQDKVCVAATYRAKRVDVRTFTSSSDIFKSPKWEKRYETLKAGGSFEPATEDLDEADSYVAIGDPVVQVIDDRA